MRGPVWWTDKNKMYSEETKPSMEELNRLKEQLYNELKKLIKL